MAVSVLKDVLISKSQLDRYFEGSVPVNLWRAMNMKASGHPFEFIESPTVLSNGRPRRADIKIEVVQGEQWVRINNRPRGISTFDSPGAPAGKNWAYFRIPKGTVLPYGLAIVRDEYNTVYEATHYTLAPAFDMPLARFKLLLKQLAFSLVREVG